MKRNTLVYSLFGGGTLMRAKTCSDWIPWVMDPNELLLTSPSFHNNEVHLCLVIHQILRQLPNIPPKSKVPIVSSILRLLCLYLVTVYLATYFLST